MKDDHTIHDTAVSLEETITKQLQAERRLERLKRREAYQRKRNERGRSERTHRLCYIGGAIEHFYPEISSFTEQEFYRLTEELYDNENLRSKIMEGIEMIVQLRGEGGG